MIFDVMLLYTGEKQLHNISLFYIIIYLTRVLFHKIGKLGAT
jgi:hypothetical protein